MVEAPTQERPNQAEVRTRTLRARGSTTWGYPHRWGLGCTAPVLGCHCIPQQSAV